MKKEKRFLRGWHGFCTYKNHKVKKTELNRLHSSKAGYCKDVRRGAAESCAARYAIDL